MTLTVDLMYDFKLGNILNEFHAAVIICSTIHQEVQTQKESAENQQELSQQHVQNEVDEEKKHVTVKAKRNQRSRKRISPRMKLFRLRRKK